MVSKYNGLSISFSLFHLGVRPTGSADDITKATPTEVRVLSGKAWQYSELAIFRKPLFPIYNEERPHFRKVFDLSLK